MLNLDATTTGRGIAAIEEDGGGAGHSDRCTSAQDRRAISGPLTSVKGGPSRSLTDSLSRRSGPVEARTAQIPKLIVRVRFSSPALSQYIDDYRAFVPLIAIDIDYWSVVTSGMLFPLIYSHIRIYLRRWRGGYQHPSFYPKSP